MHINGRFMEIKGDVCAIMRKGTYPKGWGTRKGETGKGARAAQARRAKEATTKRVTTGKADVAGEAEAKLRAAGVSEADIKAGGSEVWRKGSTAYKAAQKQTAKVAALTPSQRARLTPAQRAGKADLPGEARAKMIEAGVLTPRGKEKEIVGYYKDPETGTYKFVAKGEPVPIIKVPVGVKEPEIGVITPEIKKEVPTMAGLTPAEVTRREEYLSATAYRPMAFEPTKVPEPTKFDVWIEAQKKRLGLGGVPAAKEYERVSREYELMRLGVGAPTKTDITEKEAEIREKYEKYEEARGISPMAVVKVEPEKTYAYKAHELAERLRAGRVPLPSPPVEYAAETITEAVAANIEFFGGAPTALRRGLPVVAKEPSLMIPLVAVTGYEFARAVKEEPIQTVTTMAVGAGILRAGVKGVRAAPRPIIEPGIDVYGLKTPSYKAVYMPKIGEYRIETPKGIKAGKVVLSAKEKALMARIEPGIKKPIDFEVATYRTLKMEDVPVKMPKIEVAKPIKPSVIPEELVFGEKVPEVRPVRMIKAPKPEIERFRAEAYPPVERIKPPYVSEELILGAKPKLKPQLLRAAPRGVRMLWKEEAARVSMPELMEVPKRVFIEAGEIYRAPKPWYEVAEVRRVKAITKPKLAPMFAPGVAIPAMMREREMLMPSERKMLVPPIIIPSEREMLMLSERDITRYREREEVRYKPALVQAFRTEQLLGMKPAQALAEIPKLKVPTRLKIKAPLPVDVIELMPKRPVKRIPKIAKPPKKIRKRIKRIKKVISKAKRREIVNPIASVEKVMGAVSGM